MKRTSDINVIVESGGGYRKEMQPHHWICGWERIALYASVPVEIVKEWANMYDLPVCRPHPRIKSVFIRRDDFEEWVCEMQTHIPRPPLLPDVEEDEIDEEERIFNEKWAKTSMANNLRTRLSRALRESVGGKRQVSAVRDLGCTIHELRQYIERQFLPGMTWSNYGHGRGKWCIDHIFPLAKTDLANPDELRRTCHYTNLRPLWFLDNIRKGAKIIATTETESPARVGGDFEGLASVTTNGSPVG